MESEHVLEGILKLLEKNYTTTESINQYYKFERLYHAKHQERYADLMEEDGLRDHYEKKNKVWQRYISMYA